MGKEKELSEKHKREIMYATIVLIFLSFIGGVVVDRAYLYSDCPITQCDLEIEPLEAEETVDTRYSFNLNGSFN